MKKLINDRSGELHLVAVFLFVALLAIALFITEYLRVFDLRQHLDDELSRAVNLGVKHAMYDSYMWDREEQLDEGKAIASFYEYLHKTLGLNPALQKIEDGEIVYSLVIDNINVSGANARMGVSATAFADAAFFTFGRQWEIRVNVLSRNIPLY